jgi:hypothetical protein
MWHEWERYVHRVWVQKPKARENLETTSRDRRIMLKWSFKK